MKRRIAAVLMADATGLSRALAEGEPAAVARLADYHSVIADIVASAGGRRLAGVGEAVLAEFPSAVQAVRSAVDVQETLRARNRPLGIGERLDFKLGITIGELIEGGNAVAPETLTSAAHLVALAAPGGLCISRSVREAVANKLAIKFQDLTIEGERIDSDTQATYRVAIDRPTAPTRSGGFVPRVKLPRGIGAGLAGLAVGAIAVVVAMQGWHPEEAPPPEAPPAVVARPAAPPESTPAPSDQAAPPAVAPEPAPRPAAKEQPGGKLEFLPSKAPDPSTILTAKNMLPNAWRDCRSSDAAVAAAGCKTLLDSGLPKDTELAAVQLWNGKALRQLNRLEESIEALSASIATEPTAVAHIVRGTVYYDRRAYDEAIADYTAAIKLDDANGEAYNNRAWTFYESGRAKQALADADNAVRLLGREAYVWDTRGHIHAKLGNKDLATRDFKAALAIDPSYAASREGLVKLGVE